MCPRAGRSSAGGCRAGWVPKTSWPGGVKQGGGGRRLGAGVSGVDGGRVGGRGVPRR